MSIIAPISTSPAQGAAQKTLAGNFDTFLTLLTTQLQNQDPLNPMDSNQFTQQLVEFSQVEQQINTNDNLKTLISLGQNRSTADAMSYLGKAVTISNGAAALTNGSAVWNYQLGAEASDATLTVRDASGRVVYVGAADKSAGIHSFNWDGKDNAGNQQADGPYVLSINATGSDGSNIPSAIASGGVVTEVDFSGSEPMLMLGNLPVRLSDITSVGNLPSN
jgi:flagellar basal-body rod modification protein FlgD